MKKTKKNKTGNNEKKIGRTTEQISNDSFDDKFNKNLKLAMLLFQSGKQ